VVQAVFGSAELPEARLRTMVARAAGNPFFLEELAWYTREQGRTDTPDTVPETVYAVLDACMDWLPPEEKRLLQTAAVIGMEVPYTLLQAITDLSEEDMHRSLEHLQAVEFLYETRVVPELTYTFKHALTHEVAYGSLLLERRRVLHARIVEAMETLYADRLAEQVDRLAHHALQGEVWDKALAYCRQAGEMARQQSAYREMVGYFEHVLNALQHLPESRETREQAIDLRILLSMPLRACGEFGRDLGYLREAEALAQALNDQRRLGEVLVRMTHHFRMLGDYDNAIETGQRGFAIATALGDFPLQVTANVFLGQVYHAVGEYRRGIDFLRQNVASLVGNLRYERFQGNTSIAVISYAGLIRYLANLGAFAEGIPLGEEGIRIAEVVDRPYERVSAYSAAGYLWLHKGDLSKAVPLLERALSFCQEAPIRDQYPRGASALGVAYALSGRLAAALPLLEQGVEQATATGVMLDHAFWLASMGEAYLFAGRQAEALALAERALALARTYKERGNEAYILQILGEILAHRDPSNAEGAERHYHQALALAEELGMRPLQVHCHRSLGTLYATTGQTEHARVELSTAMTLYRDMEMTFWLPQAKAALAQVERQ
jgi:tetratricopeptide (TPR) repeat protein